MKKKLIINGKNTFVLSKTLLKVLSEINIISNQNIAIAVNEKVIEKNNWKDYIFKANIGWSGIRYHNI